MVMLVAVVHEQSIKKGGSRYIANAPRSLSLSGAALDFLLVPSTTAGQGVAQAYRFWFARAMSDLWKRWHRIWRWTRPEI